MVSDDGKTIEGGWLGPRDASALVAEIRKYITHLPNDLTGCIRRNMWTQDEETPWSMISGNAYLSVVATPQTVHTGLGMIGVWMYNRTVIGFRGGPIRSWWLDDMLDEWILTQAYSGFKLPPYLYIVQEDGGRLKAYQYAVSEYIQENAEALAGQIIKYADQDPPGRLAKNTERAYHTCKYCTVKRRCDTADQVDPIGKEDWGRHYPYP